MSKLPALRCSLIILAALLAAPIVSAAEKSDKDLLNSLEWRDIGPWRGGRVTTVTGVRGNPQLYYMGAAGGGVWRTTNAGVTWENISDGYFKVGTIGAVAVAPSDPNVLYVGTGEAPIRGVTTSDGDGIWKSTDAGATWRHLGLEKAGQISRIRVHPTNPDIAWVAVQGLIWAPTEERGVYKTTDGGATWHQVLKVNPSTGAADLAIDPANPRILYAAMWHHGRKPWFIESGGEGGGIYKSTDGGETWHKLGGGLPDLVGKIGIDVAASEPDRVYAIVEAPEKQGGLYASEDAGATWTLVNDRRVLYTRPWYYERVTVDPMDANSLWIMNVPLMKSIDGGKTFHHVSQPHGDNHDQWINPDNSLNMINGNDGGAAITFDGGKTWSSLDNQPTAQFYRAVTDEQTPFRIYAGQQDNTTVAIASASDYRGIGTSDWHDIGGGESAWVAFDPKNPRLIYATTINNMLTEYDEKTAALRPIQPYPEHVYGWNARDLKYRANWNAPVIVSPHDPSVIYYGAQVLLKSSDRGLNWTEVSPDLTRNQKDRQGRNGGPITPENVGAEFYNTIFYIVESPHEQGVIWVGSDDGLVHLTRDGGAHWDDVTPKGAPEGLVNAIEVSPHDAATAYITVAAYKLNDFHPYVYLTSDYGKHWQRIDKGLPQDTFVRVVREDPQDASLLYAGTEHGMFVSFDRGEHWRSMQMNLPPVPITDLTIRDSSLVAATQGRGFWVLDDLSMVRQLASAPEGTLHVFKPSDQRLGRNDSSPDEFEGANPPAGVVLHYALASDAKDPLTIDILDGDGKLVRSYSSEANDHDRCVLSNSDLRRPFEVSHPTANKGMNSWEWDLRREQLRCIANAHIWIGFGGATVTPGPYQARVRVDGTEQTVAFRVNADPRVKATPQQVAAWAENMAQLTNLFNEIEGSIAGARQAREQIRALLEGHPGAADLQEAGSGAIDAIDQWEASVSQQKFDTYEDEDAWPTLVNGQVRLLLRSIDDSGPPVTAGALQRKADLEAQWSQARAKLQSITDDGIRAVNAWAREHGVEYVTPPQPASG